MNVQLPPFLFYFVGVVLMAFGTLRAIFLGKRQQKEAAAEQALDEDPVDHERAARKARDARRHVIFGLVWVGMGLFLVISTFLNTRR